MKAAAVALSAALLGAGPAAVGPLSGVHNYASYTGAPLMLECPAMLECIVDLKPGEVILPRLLSSQAQLWDPQVLYSGTTPHLVLRPDAINRRANFVLASTGEHSHLYVIMAVSTDPKLPMMRVSYRYEAEDRYDAAQAMEKRRQVAAVPKPLTIGQTMAAACAANHDAYGITPPPPPNRHRGDDDIVRAIRPAQVCHTDRQTYMRLATTPAARADIPVIVEVASDGERAVNPYYRDGIFRVDDVAREYVLVQGSTRVRVQWQPEKTATR